MTTLLFSPEYVYLGELLFKDGCLERCSLSHEGEAEVGDLVAAWQTQGILLKERRGDVLAGASITLPSPDAEFAFLCWAADTGYITLKLPDRLFTHWEKLCRMTLAPEERFVSLRALLTASHAVLQAWDQAMDQTLSPSRASSPRR